MRIPCLAIAAAALSFPAGAQTLFKCVLPTGRTVYQDSPCEDAAKQSTVRNPDAPTPPPLPPGDERRDLPPEAPMESIVQAIISYQGCAQEVPGFAARFRPNYDDWKLRNVAALVRYGRDEKSQERVRDALLQQMQNAPTDPQAKEERAATCEKEVKEALGPPKPRS